MSNAKQPHETSLELEIRQAIADEYNVPVTSVTETFTDVILEMESDLLRREAEANGQEIIDGEQLRAEGAEAKIYVQKLAASL